MESVTNELSPDVENLATHGKGRNERALNEGVKTSVAGGRYGLCHRMYHGTGKRRATL
jgi:hypothetical protein